MATARAGAAAASPRPASPASPARRLGALRLAEEEGAGDLLPEVEGVEGGGGETGGTEDADGRWVDDEAPPKEEGIPTRPFDPPRRAELPEEDEARKAAAAAAGWADLPAALVREAGRRAGRGGGGGGPEALAAMAGACGAWRRALRGQQAAGAGRLGVGPLPPARLGCPLATPPGDPPLPWHQPRRALWRARAAALAKDDNKYPPATPGPGGAPAAAAAADLRTPSPLPAPSAACAAARCRRQRAGLLGAGPYVRELEVGGAFAPGLEPEWPPPEVAAGGSGEAARPGPGLLDGLPGLRSLRFDDTAEAHGFHGWLVAALGGRLRRDGAAGADGGGLVGTLERVELKLGHVGGALRAEDGTRDAAEVAALFALLGQLRGLRTFALDLAVPPAFAKGESGVSLTRRLHWNLRCRLDRRCLRAFFAGAPPLKHLSLPRLACLEKAPPPAEGGDAGGDDGDADFGSAEGFMRGVGRSFPGLVALALDNPLEPVDRPTAHGDPLAAMAGGVCSAGVLGLAAALLPALQRLSVGSLLDCIPEAELEALREHARSLTYLELGFAREVPADHVEAIRAHLPASVEELYVSWSPPRGAEGRDGEWHWQRGAGDLGGA